MELGNIRHVFLIGIGGIGMSALARYFKRRGCDVSGYDRTSTALANALIAEGIHVVFEDTEKALPQQFNEPRIANLVIYTPAVPADSVIVKFLKNRGFDLKKRSQVLGLISSGMYTIAVAGTHGKTTTSTMIAYILKHSGFDCTAFLGGIASNYDTNILFGDNNVVVVEADEYDRSFLTLHPDIAVITSMDADHLDIYGDRSHLTESFKLFASQVKPGGKLIYRHGLELEGGITYAASVVAQIYASNVHIKNGDFYFDIVSEDEHIKDIRLGIPGLHNVENAVAAVQVSLLLGIEPAKIKIALGDFKGVKRRFEYIVKNNQHIYIDDYAHHPEELRACITAVKDLYPDKRLTTIFQPHLFTRTRDFADGFAEVLGMSDQLILLDIYPARELPIAGINSELILSKVQLTDKQKCEKTAAVKLVKAQMPALLLTVGAGDIDTMVEPLKKILDHV